MQKNKLWFKRKLFGWGWTPASWEGWMVLAVWVFLFTLGEFLFLSAMKFHPSRLPPTLFVLFVFLSVVALLMICYKKGEKPRWQWGRDKK